ncbi:hypothetical protein [Promicromonospora sp. AC04]|uniref:hypothetical protein n=1 Tax=Promicromonospora sp. AC04 TaxID=2135723 RepID=UPI0011B1C874|nr:hypothetical protein [Promicromonospora sp. AC04]
MDLNILPLSALEAVLQRLLANEERPWDGMFAQIQVLDTTSAELDQIVGAISLAYRRERSPEASEIDALRYSVSRTIGDVESASSPLGLHLITGQAISAILFAWTAVVGKRWSGLRDALRQLSVSEPLQVQRSEAIIRERNPQQRLLMLRELESWVFRAVGGAWRDEVLVLKTGIDAGQTRSGSIAMTNEQRAGLQRFLLDPPGSPTKPSV